jgi:hypothetical protein
LRNLEKCPECLQRFHVEWHFISSNYIFKGLAFETLGPWCKKPSISLISSETDLSRNQAIQNQRNSFLRGFSLPFNVETLQAFGVLFQIPHYYRKFLHCKLKMLCNCVIYLKKSKIYHFNFFFLQVSRIFCLLHNIIFCRSSDLFFSILHIPFYLNLLPLPYSSFYCRFYSFH